MVRYGRPKGWQIIWVVLCQSVRTNLLFVHCFELCINRIHLHILVLRHGSISPLAKIGIDQFQLKLELWFVYMLEMLGASLKYRASCWQQYDTTMWMSEKKMHDNWGNFNLHFSKNIGCEMGEVERRLQGHAIRRGFWWFHGLVGIKGRHLYS